MINYFFYNNPAVNFSLWGAFGFFTLFLVFVLLAKLGSGIDSYRKLNQAHFKFFIAYFLTSIFYGYYSDNFDLFLLVGLSVGSFIFYSLHYVYLFSIVGLIKKSISINILVCLREVEINGITATAEALSLLMEKRNLGFSVIRDSRLEQMVLLGFAKKEGNFLKMTQKGKLVNFLGFYILKIWNLNRL